MDLLWILVFGSWIFPVWGIHTIVAAENFCANYAMNDPFVSIIIRSYNEGWALRETLPALQAQEHKRWELIVIDSGSMDDSVDLTAVIREDILLAFPAHPVCDPHCAGLAGVVT